MFSAMSGIKNNNNNIYSNKSPLQYLPYLSTYKIVEKFTNSIIIIIIERKDVSQYSPFLLG